MLLPNRLPRPARLGLYALAAVILLAMCLLPSKDLPQTGAGDRFEHTAAWFVLTLTGYVLAPRRVWAIPAFALAYGMAIELLQGTVGTGRHADPMDLVADVVGIALAVVVYLLARRIVRR